MAILITRGQGRGEYIIIESISIGYWDAKGIQRRSSYTRWSKKVWGPGMLCRGD